jgi:general secretion pathway protein K
MKALLNKKAYRQRGIALIVVLIVIVVLGILAGGFAYTMRVETTLARNASFNTELDWIGRAGVGYCQWLLSKPCPYDALTQRWARGPGDKCEGMDPATGELIRDESILDEVPVGHGSFTWEIVDQDRYFNINRTDEMLLNEAFTLIGVDAGEMTAVVNSILDWRDLDKNPRMSGTESEVYEQQDPPYVAKDGPLDDMSELLLIRGVTPGMYRGSAGGPLPRIMNRAAGRQSAFEEPVYAVGLQDLFCALSGPTVNINTTTAQVLQMVPGIDENIAMAIIQERDGVNGPYQSPLDVLRRVPGLPIDPNLLGRFFGVKSFVFKAVITAKISGASRKYVAMLVRMGATGRAQSTSVLNFYSLNSEAAQ